MDDQSAPLLLSELEGLASRLQEAAERASRIRVVARQVAEDATASLTLVEEALGRIRTQLRNARDQGWARLVAAAVDLISHDPALLNDAKRRAPDQHPSSAGRVLMLESGQTRDECERAVRSALELVDGEQHGARRIS